MTVSSETSKSGPYTGNGVTVAFPYGFRILDAAHIKVVRTENGADTVLTTGFTVSGVGAASGSVTFAVAPTAAQKITLIRNAPFTQQVDLENQGAYYAEVVEQAFDLAAMRDQQMNEGLARAVKLPVGSDPSGLSALTEDLIRLSDSADEIDTVAGIAADVTTVAGLTAEIAALPGQVTGAQAAAAAAVAALDSFDDRYLGAKAVAPTLDNDGNALLVGAVYWDTASNQMFTWTGSEWLPTFVSGSAVRALVTATGGQTVLTVPTYIVGANTIQVYLNGLKVMVSADYSETNQNTITFLSGLTAGDEVEVIVLQPYAIGTTGAESITTEYGVTLARLLELRDGTVADLLADTTLTYSGVAAGDGVEAGGFRYQVAASGAVDQHLSTAGGVKLYVLPDTVGYNVKAFGAKGDNVTDDTVAIQKALDCVPNVANSYAPSKLSGGGGRLRLMFPRGAYIVSSVLDCSQRDYVEIDTDGRATIYSTSTTYILDASSTDHCTFRNIALYSETARVGIYIDRCTSAPYVQYNTYENIAITLTTNTAANGGLGRIGIWNGRGELNHYRNVEIRADLPLYATNVADAAFSPTSGTLQTLFVTSVINTYIGCLFIGHTAHSPCMVLRGSVSHEFIDCYWAQANTASGALPYAAIAYGISSCKFTGTVETLPSFMLIAEFIAYFNHIDVAFQNNLDGRGVIQMEDAANTVGLCASTVRVGVSGAIPAGSAVIKVVPTALNALISGNSIYSLSTLPPITAGSNAVVKGNTLSSEAGLTVKATSVISPEVTSAFSTVLTAVATGTPTTAFTTEQYRSYLVTAYLYNGGANFIASATVVNDGTNVVLVNYASAAFMTLTVSGSSVRVTQSSGGPNDVIVRVLAL